MVVAGTVSVVDAMVGGVVAADDRRAVRVSGAVVDRGSKTEFFSRISHLFAHHRIVVFP